MTDIVVLGNGVAANLAAAYFRKALPELGVTVVGRNPERRPIVGESLVEISTQFIRELGLGSLLIERHLPKYGLTYYYKQALDDPTDRQYVVDEAPALPPFPSFEVNRFSFDRDLRAHNAATGVAFREDRIVSVELEKGRHKVTSEGLDGERREICCRWLVDATGRTRVLGRRLGLHHRTDLQKDVFWFWLADFDPSILGRIDAIKKENRGFDSYYCTHHFFGRGNWIWCIPISSEDGRRLISIGITYRKDLHPREIRSVGDFLEQVGAEHPVVGDLVRSGTVQETNFYGSYMYEAKQRYAPEGWFLVGDAADTVDPLYSLGLALISLQIRQVGAAIAKARLGEPIDDFVRDLDLAFENAHHLATREITDLYRVMHDGYQCHLRMHLAILAMFHIAVPLTLCGYMWDPAGVRIFNRLLRSSPSSSPPRRRIRRTRRPKTT
jgi:flavin-dependent dehydrogenase